MQSVQKQYQKYPYPPIPWFVLPKITQDQLADAARRGDRLEDHYPGAIAEVRALILGSGTFEPVGVGMEYPDLKSIHALDFSGANLSILKKRIFLTRILNRIPKIKIIREDLESWQPSAQSYEWIRASNVLHHLKNPNEVLSKIRTALSPRGMSRIVIYPRSSRLEMRWLSKFFQSEGLTPEKFLDRFGQSKFRKALKQASHSLALSDPRRAAWDSNIEKGHISGIIDAFFHAYENPASMIQWVQWFYDHHFEWVDSSQAGASLKNRIIELQVNDDLGLIERNPVFWLKPVAPGDSNHAKNVDLIAELKNTFDGFNATAPKDEFKDLSAEKKFLIARSNTMKRLQSLS